VQTGGFSLVELFQPTTFCNTTRFPIPKKGFRTKVVIVVTTLLNPKIYTKTQLAQLYGLRWEVEVNLRHVKTTLGMEQLRWKTPSMVRKEIYVHLMAYNLLRT